MNHTESLDHNPPTNFPSDLENEPVQEEEKKGNEISAFESSEEPIVTGDEEREVDQEHQLEECELITTKNERGEIVFEGQPTITLKEEIGSGNFCKVFRAVGVYQNFDNLTINYAFKVYYKQGLRKDTLVRNELARWGRVNHKNIVKIFTLYESEKEDKMYVLMQYADMGQIAD